MLEQPLKSLIRTTPAHLKKLEKMGIFTGKDLLEYFPRDLEDTKIATNLSSIHLNEKNTIEGDLHSFTVQKTKFGKRIAKAILSLDDSDIEVVWFAIPYNMRNFEGSKPAFLVGKIKRNYGKIQISNPEIHFKQNIHIGKIRPVYPESPPITSKWLREKITGLLSLVDGYEEVLPKIIVQTENLLSKVKAIQYIHFPETTAQWYEAKKRLGFEEIFTIQLRVIQAKFLREKQQESFFKVSFQPDIIKKDLGKLPFELTTDQKKALAEILKDFEKNRPMHRLLQGDVGSGKTIVAFLAALQVIRVGYQVVILAPTEILAQQHFEAAMKFLAEDEVFEKEGNLFQKSPLRKVNCPTDKRDSLGIKGDLGGFAPEQKPKDLTTKTTPNIKLLTGSTPAKQKKEIKKNLKTGKVKLLIGTHAVLTEDTIFKNLGFAVIDEQHRFGVAQRAILAENQSHVLAMTATPIPRSLALTVYGDQDCSIIAEKPAGRKPIITRVIGDDQTRKKCEYFIDDQIGKGRQIFWVCPLVDVSDKIEARNVKSEYERIAQVAFPNRKVAFLHGKMKPKEKALIMEDFKNHAFDILVSTSVIEVGVDIPNSTVMVIENAERFGLAQLHQFRGRIGRNDYQSYCFLMVDKRENKQKERLRAMEQSNDGFYLSEIDLQLRGSGDIYGIKQSGIPDLKCADLNDIEGLKKARDWATKILKEDPDLKNNPVLKERIAAEQVYF